MGKEPVRSTYQNSLAFVVLVICGCGGKNSNDPPFKLSGFTKISPNEPNVQILNPINPVKIKPRGRILCQIQITLPSGGELPRDIIPQFYSGEKPGVIGELLAESAHDNVFVLKANLRVPENVGIYRLVIHCDYYVKPGWDDVNATKSTPAQRVRFTTIGPTLEVAR